MMLGSMLNFKDIKSVEPYGRGGVEYRHRTTGNRCEHLLSNMFVAAPTMLHQLLLDLEQTFRLEFSLMKLLSQKD